MIRIVTIFVVLLTASCGSYDSAMQAIESTEKLEAQNQHLQAQVRILEKKLKNAMDEAQSSREEAEKLRAEKKALENMSEERIKKFILMYEGDT